MLYVIGIGPGNPEYMTEEATRALAECDLVVGYPFYLEFVKKRFPDKEYYGTPMTREIERCRYALSQAGGRTVALVCSGDAGVYGMAGPVLEMAPEYPETEVRVISGVTAALAGGARLGAPLMHDFAVISLSDRLTPMEEICRKLKNAAEGGFVIALYNPSSKKRKDHLRMACDILLSCLAPSTVCGYVRNVGRDDPECGILSLAELKTFDADMFTTVFIGNSRTKAVGGRMVTPRGYEEKMRISAGYPKDTATRPEGANSMVSETDPTHPGQGRDEAGNPAGVGNLAATDTDPENAESGRDKAGDPAEAEILVAAGTTEGRRLCEYFAGQGRTVYAFVATEYGEEMLPESPHILTDTGRKSADEMLEFIRKHRIRTCYDAMHPYATLAHKNMREACERGGCAYTRVLREQEEIRIGGTPEEEQEKGRIGEMPKAGSEKECAGGTPEEEQEKGRIGKKPKEGAEKNCAGKIPEILRVGSVREAAEVLKKRDGNIFVTTGSRELEPFAEIDHFEERVWVRVLPSAESLEACHRAGFQGPKIIAMHGPFSKEMNELILREHDIQWMVTKESGKAGGFSEKLEAAQAAGARVILVERPREKEGVMLEELISQLAAKKRNQPRKTAEK